MGSPTNINEVQRLTGRMASLNRFIIKSSEKGLPFFKTIGKVKNIEWTEEYHQAFEELKTYLAKLPLLVKPIPGDTLHLYLSSTSQAISFVLVREENGARTPTYYVSKVLNGAECRYLPIEKMALALITTAWKLHLYFLSYPIGVLADFVSEMTGTTQAEVTEERPWLLHVDRSSTAQGNGAGIVITSPQGEDMEFAIKFNFKASNNEAEYEALVNREYEAKEDSMTQYLQQIEELKTKFQSFQLQKILRKENDKADSLSKLARAVEDCRTQHITVQHLLRNELNSISRPLH
ncbi:UNVERIFIED_CONTAM: hypothetical protein Sradi_1312900 [Sesamum radiatum]|uniref:Reverse transcriptase/retrotransposon-derived protein RNase H-like domain-containing protein n=1 Tax=Sesamum radiatum TaxID=300843 RepID=A0AAW2UPM5_SESRA